MTKVAQVWRRTFPWHKTQILASSLVVATNFKMGSNVNLFTNKPWDDSTMQCNITLRQKKLYNITFFFFSKKDYIFI
jgi:hypothetical protein